MAPAVITMTSATFLGAIAAGSASTKRETTLV